MRKVRISSWVIIIISLMYIGFITCANLQLVDHPYAWEVDEIADMDSIQKIHSIESTKDFYTLLVKNQMNNVHGIITLYVPALVSVVPKIFFGEKSVIFVFKMTSSLLLLISILILVFGFLHNALLRISILFFLIAMPYTGMFMTWPRCESYLYFFYTVFLWMQHRSDYKSSFSFLFLGMALISRISLALYLPLLFIFPVCAVVINADANGVNKTKGLITSSLHRMFFFFLGVILADPFLMLPQNILTFIARKKFLMYEDTGVKAWINFEYWMTKISPEYFQSTVLFCVVLIIMVLGGSGILLFRNRLHLIDKSVVNNKSIFFFFTHMIVSVGGIFLIASEVKTDTSWYWHFYICLGVISFIYLVSTLREVILVKMLNITIFVISCLFLSNYLQVTPFIKNRIKIEKSEEFLSRLHEYKESKKLLNQICKKVNSTIHVRVLADQFQLADSGCFKVYSSWYPGPFYRMTDDIDIILFDYNELKPGSVYNQKKDGDWLVKKESESVYHKMVVKGWGGNCEENTKCFRGKMVTSRILMLYREGLVSKKEASVIFLK